MITYIYKAKKSNAETITGKINAENEEEAIELINQLGFLPISVAPQKEEEGSKKNIKRAISKKEVYIFSRQLANLIKSGVSILRSLYIIEEQTQNSNFKKIISDIIKSIKEGNSFSQSLSYYPNVFSGFYISLIHAGEESGNLHETLVSLAIYQKKQSEIVMKIKQALTYPVFMLIMGILTVCFILSFVTPKMSSLFENMGSNLPLPTLILLNISNFVSKSWFIILIVLILILFLFKFLNLFKKLNLFMNKISIYIPYIGEILIKTEISRFCRTLNLLLRNGLPFVKALEISIPVLNNESIKKRILKSKEKLISGSSFGESIKNYSEIPGMVGHLFSIGEESGNLNDILNEIAESFEQEVDEIIKSFTTLLEPIMILFIGFIIGFIVFAMLLPIFEIDVFMK